MSTTQLLIFLFERIDNISQFIAGFYFLRCLDCCLERRKGKLLFFIACMDCMFGNRILGDLPAGCHKYHRDFSPVFTA